MLILQFANIKQSINEQVKQIYKIFCVDYLLQKASFDFFTWIYFLKERIYRDKSDKNDDQETFPHI